jgi:hypothetical protein
LAPAASSFFLISSASSFLTPSLSLAEPFDELLRFSKTEAWDHVADFLDDARSCWRRHHRMTSNSVFSSTTGAAAPPPPAAAAATGAAALTPHFSSRVFTSSATSRTVKPLSSSTILFNISHISLSVSPFPEASDLFKSRKLSLRRGTIGCFLFRPCDGPSGQIGIKRISSSFVGLGGWRTRPEGRRVRLGLEHAGEGPGRSLEHAEELGARTSREGRSARALMASASSSLPSSTPAFHLWLFELISEGLHDLRCCADFLHRQ